MKSLFAFALIFSTSAFALFPSIAFAIPGATRLNCESLPGAKVKVSLKLFKFHIDTDDFPASVELKIGDKSIKLEEPSRTALSLIVKPNDKVVTASYVERGEKQIVELQIWNKPASLRGKGDECSGEFQFRAGFNGSIFMDNDSSPYTDEQLKCEVSYTGGSAC